MKSNQNRTYRKVISWNKTFNKIGTVIDQINREQPDLNIYTCDALIKALYRTYLKEYGKVSTNARMRHAHSYFAPQIKRSQRTIFRQVARLLQTPFIVGKESAQKPAKDREGKDYTLNCTLFILNDDIIQYAYNGDVWDVDKAKNMADLSTKKNQTNVDSEYSIKSHLQKTHFKPK